MQAVRNLPQRWWRGPICVADPADVLHCSKAYVYKHVALRRAVRVLLGFLQCQPLVLCTICEAGPRVMQSRVAGATAALLTTPHRELSTGRKWPALLQCLLYINIVELRTAAVSLKMPLVPHSSSGRKHAEHQFAAAGTTSFCYRLHAMA